MPAPSSSVRIITAIGLVVGLATLAAAQSTLQPADWDAELKPQEANDINLPGPLIRAHVGDRLIVHFSNELPAPTTVHWHGVRIPVEMDGVPGVSQSDVLPGQSFTYDFVLRDAGLFWYHPHVMSAAQVGFGLYGALLVEDPSDGVGVADELVLVLSDLALGDNGRLEPPDSGGSIGMVFGREGNRVLVNGQWHRTLKAREGAPERWRIVNAAKSRYFQLDLGGQTFTRIGGDGGLQEYSQESTELELAPDERADVIVTPRAHAGEKVVLRSGLFNRGYGSIEYRDVEDLFAIDFSALSPYNGPPAPKITHAVSPIPTTGAREVPIHLTLDQLPSGSFEFGIDHVAFAKGDGNPVRPLAWKDTVDVPFEQTVRLAVRFDERPGSWMYHCHILDHADGGLMGMVDVGVDDHSSHNPILQDHIHP